MDQRAETSMPFTPADGAGDGPAGVVFTDGTVVGAVLTATACVPDASG